MLEFDTHPQWPHVIKIIKKLKRAQHEAVLAGGCVRDKILGRPCKDFDIATSATPEAVKALFPNANMIGAQFGVVMIPFGPGIHFEVASFRKDGLYVDGRRPESVEYSSMEEDAHRRDFTINALFYDPIQRRIYDFVDGQADIKSRIIRSVGAAQSRFEEDYLRVARALRFSSQLQFRIEAETEAAVKSCAKGLQHVAAERKFQEVQKWLAGPGFKSTLSLFFDSPLAEELLPNLDGLKWEDVSKDTYGWLAGPEKLSAEKLLSYLYWFQYQQPSLAYDKLDQDLNHLKSSNEFKQRSLIPLAHAQLVQSPEKNLWQALVELPRERLSKETFSLVKLFLKDDPPASEKIDKHAELTRGNGAMPTPRWSAKDLLSRGMAPGPALGATLKQVYIHQLQSPTASEDELLEVAITAYRSASQ